MSDKSKVSDGKKNKKLDLSNFKDLFMVIKNAENLYDLSEVISDHLNGLVKNASLKDDFKVLYLYQPYESIDEKMVDRIYEAVGKEKNSKILLILNSNGGQVEPAYLISKTCKEKAHKFVVAVPRKAKSAATLIAFGGVEIHMGTTSELGPIDPQFGGLPALSLGSALNNIAKIVTDNPRTSDMFAGFLSNKLDLRILGYFERVTESAMHYAQRLLKDKPLAEGKTVARVAEQFVYAYKDHSFVIDKEEAKNFLGPMIKENTPEYKLSNEIHEFLSQVNILTEIVHGKLLGVVGSADNLMVVRGDKE